MVVRGIYQKSKDDEVQTTKTDKPKIISCTRITRLNNKPPYDRALSLIQEKYNSWDKNNEDLKEWFFFPSQLANCIKIVEGDVRNTSGIEGYFKFNSDEIQEDYFPIVVDKDYSYVDDSINSLILIHEITHVQQFLDTLNNIDTLSCIDKEAEAYYAQWVFYGMQFPETRKSIDYRIENDSELHPQLRIIQSIKNHLNLDGVRNECLYGAGKENPKCISDYRKNEIKKLLLQDDYYLKQCKL